MTPGTDPPPHGNADDEGSWGCLWGCLLVVVVLGLLLLLRGFDSPLLGAYSWVALGLTFLGRLIPGLPRRWFGPPVTPAGNAREFWVVLACGLFMLVGGLVELWASFGAR